MCFRYKLRFVFGKGNHARDIMLIYPSFTMQGRNDSRSAIFLSRLTAKIKWSKIHVFTLLDLYYKTNHFVQQTCVESYEILALSLFLSCVLLI